MAITIQFEKYEAVVLSKSPAKILIRWKMDCETHVLADYEFIVERGDAQDNIPGFQHVDMLYRRPVTPGITSTETDNIDPLCRAIDGLEQPWYLDYAPALKNLSKIYYYRIRCRQKSTQEEIVTPVFSIDKNLDMGGLYIVDEHNFLLEDAIGVPSLVFNRKNDGVYCECFDRIQKKTTRSNCKICYGTNWVGGFHDPIDCFIDYSPDIKQSVIMDWGETKPTETDILMSNFPQIWPKDVILEITQLRYWRVVRVKEVERRRVPMLQFARLVEINPGDVEYNLKAKDDFVLKKLKELQDYMDKREF